MDKAKQEVEPLNHRVDAFLAREHERLDHILQDVEYLSERGSFHLAAKRFAEFRRGIEEHTAAEERVLLPLFVEKTGDPGGISQEIHTEHQVLLAMLQDMADAISQWNHVRFCELLVELDALTKRHHQHEKQVLHPIFESVLETEADWARLCEQFQRVTS